MKTKIIGLAIVSIIIITFAGFLFFSQKQEKLNIVSLAPADVVEVFIYSTLGSLENSEIDYEKAKEFLSFELKQKFTDATFIPMIYCIQDGPDEIKIQKERLEANSVNIRVSARYGLEETGEWKEMWEFVLIPDKENPDNDWLIKEIICLN